MKCPQCTRTIECVNVKKNGMWSNHWECKEHGVINHKTAEFQTVAQDSASTTEYFLRMLRKSNEEMFQMLQRKGIGITNAPININIGDIKTEPDAVDPFSLNTHVPNQKVAK